MSFGTRCARMSLMYQSACCVLGLRYEIEMSALSACHNESLISQLVEIFLSSSFFYFV